MKEENQVHIKPGTAYVNGERIEFGGETIAHIAHSIPWFRKLRWTVSGLGSAFTPGLLTGGMLW